MSQKAFFLVVFDAKFGYVILMLNMLLLLLLILHAWSMFMWNLCCFCSNWWKMMLSFLIVDEFMT